MTSHAAGVLLATALVLGGCAVEPPPATEVTQREFAVLRVIDGDTFVVMYDGEPTRVRLLAPVGQDYRPGTPWLDTPERGESGWAEARDRLAQQIIGRRVHLTFPLKSKRDGFGRLAATCGWGHDESSQPDRAGRSAPSASR